MIFPQTLKKDSYILSQEKTIMKKEEGKKKSKLRLKRISKPNEKLGVHSLDEIREVDSYTWVAKNITEEMGFPPCVKDTDDCLCCEGQLFVLRHGAEEPDQSTDSFGQVLTIINHESGSTSIFTRTLHPLQNNGEWTPWQMVATGDYELIAANNSINEILATLRRQLEDISKRVETIEASLLAGATVRFHRIEENEATINAGEIDSTPAAIVYYKPANKFVAADSAGTYWDTWGGMEAYMSGGAVRKDKVYLCGRDIYVFNRAHLINANISIEFQDFQFVDRYFTNYSVGAVISLEPEGVAPNYNSFCYYLGKNDRIHLNEIQAGGDTLYIYIVDAKTNKIIDRLNEEGSLGRKSYTYTATTDCYILGSTWLFGSINLINANALNGIKVLVDNNANDIVSLNNSINRIAGVDNFDINEYYNNGKALISTGALGAGGDWGTFYKIPLNKGDRVIVEGEVGGVLAAGYSYIQIYSTSGVLLYKVHADEKSKQPSIDYICKEECMASVCTTVPESVKCYKPIEGTYLSLLLEGENTNAPDTAIYSSEFGAFLRFGVIGDSLSVGYMTNPITGEVDGRNIPYSWGQVLARRYGNICTNFGSSGVTAKSWMIDTDCYPLLIEEGNLCQCYVVGLGVNDNETVIGSLSDINWDNAELNANTFYGDYGKVLQKVHERAPKAIIFALTIPHTHINAEARNKAIREIVTQPEIAEYCFLVDLKEDYYDIFSNVIEKHYFNWHYSAAGYAVIADVLAVALSKTMRDNYSSNVMQSVGFIPFDENQ